MLSENEASTIVDVIKLRAEATPTRTAIRLIDDSVESGFDISYSELDKSCREYAGMLLKYFSPGDRALLLFPYGKEFIYTFFGCLYAGIIPVPTYPPMRARDFSRIMGILK